MFNLKKIVFTAIFYSLLLHCFSNDLKFLKLNGNVKSLLSKTFITKDDVSLKLEAYSEMYFDEDGFFTKIKKSTNADEGYYTADFKRINDKIIEYTNGGIALPMTFRKIYDENGNLIEEFDTDEKARRFVKTTFTYDKNNHLESMICFDSNNSIEYKTFYSYSPQGKPLEHWEFTKDSNYSDKVLLFKFFYDNNSILIRSVKYNINNGNINEDFSYQTLINKDGTIKNKKKINTKDGTILKMNSYKYDKYKNVTTDYCIVYEYNDGIKRIKQYTNTYKKYTYY